MPDTGWLDPGTVVNEPIGGGADWNDVNNAKIQNDTYASSVIAKNKDSDGLKATNFSVNLPAGSTIDGIEFEFDGWNANMIDNELRVLKAGSPIGDDKASAVAWGSSDSDTYRSYGGAADKWGTTWTEAEVENIAFGFRLQAHNNQAFVTQTAWVDHVRCKIHYTEGAEAAVSRAMGRGIGKGILG